MFHVIEENVYFDDAYTGLILFLKKAQHGIESLKPCVHISRKGRKHMFANTCFMFST